MYDSLPQEGDILAALATHGATNHCPRCGTDQWLRTLIGAWTNRCGGAEKHVN